MRPEECLSTLHANANFGANSRPLKHLAAHPGSGQGFDFKIAIAALKPGLQI
jgi:hypothetical protein